MADIVTSELPTAATVPAISQDYTRGYSLLVGGRVATCRIPAPGGQVSVDDARDILRWMQQIRWQVLNNLRSG